MHITVVEADVVCLVEDGKSTFVRCIMCGRCYCQVADGIPPGWRLADVIARWQMEYHQVGGWQMLLPGGRWNG